MNRCIFAALMAAVIWLAAAPNAEAWYRGGYAYRGYGGGYAHYNSYTGGIYHGGSAGYISYTGRYGASRSYYNPYTGRYGSAQAAYNPYTNRYAYHYSYGY
jgi:hypothetical protein